jgi:hypothetical protein
MAGRDDHHSKNHPTIDRWDRGRLTKAQLAQNDEHFSSFPEINFVSLSAR